jgi:hypothetical protein
MSIAQALAKEQASIPAQVLLQQPIMFLDAMNRRTPVHLEWINSWEAFIAVLKVRFKHSGLSKIEAGEFALQATKTQRDIDRSRPWDACFLPGQSYDMSMIFRDANYAKVTSCPHCKCECAGESTQDITW